MVGNGRVSVFVPLPLALQTPDRCLAAKQSRRYQHATADQVIRYGVGSGGVPDVTWTTIEKIKRGKKTERNIALVCVYADAIL